MILDLVASSSYYLSCCSFFWAAMTILLNVTAIVLAIPSAVFIGNKE